MSAPNFIKTTKDEIQFNINTNTKTDDSVVIAHGENHGFSNASVMFFKGNNSGNNYILKIDGDTANKLEVIGDISATDINIDGSSISTLNNEYYTRQNFGTDSVRYGANTPSINLNSCTLVGFNAGSNSSGPGNTYIGKNSGNGTGFFNIGLGNATLGSNTSGSCNTAVGYQSGYSNTTGERNTFIGTYSGYNNTTGQQNSIIGYHSGCNITTGVRNVLIGASAGFCNRTGSENVHIGFHANFGGDADNSGTYIGAYAGSNITNGQQNVMVGTAAGKDANNVFNSVFIGNNAGQNTSNGYNTFVGFQSGLSNNLGSANTYVGNQAGLDGNNGSSNTMIGSDAGKNSSSSANIRSVFIGASAGLNNQAQRNVFIGAEAGLSNTSGVQNVFVGDDVGKTNSSGSFNVFVGRLAGSSNTEGSSNVSIGYATSLANSTGSNNVFIGADAGRANTTGTDNVHIGFSANFKGQTDNSGTYIGAYAGSNITNGEQNVFIGAASGKNADTISKSVFVGNNAGENTSNDNNTFVGFQSGLSNTSGSNNAYFGTNTGKDISGSNNVIIGSKGDVADTLKDLDNSVVIGFGAEASVIDSNNVFQLQNGSNSLLMTGDFGNSNIGIGLDRLPSSNYTLEVNGSMSVSGSITFNDDISNTIITSLDGTYDVGQYNVLQMNCLANGTRTFKTIRTYQVDFTSNNDQFKVCAAADSHITITNTGNYTGCELLIPYKGLSAVAGKVFVWNAGTENVVIRTFDSSGNTGTTDEYKLLPVKSGIIQTAVNSYTANSNTFQEFFPMSSAVNSNDVKWIYIDRI